MKKIFVIVILIFCITPVAFAKEYKVEAENTVLTFSIPDSYDIIDINHPDPAVLKKLGTTKDEIVKELKEDHTFLECYDLDAGNVISFGSNNSAAIKSVGDLKNFKNVIDHPNFEKEFTKAIADPDIEIYNIYKQELPNAMYAVVQGKSREPIEDGKYAYIKGFMTIKNGTAFAFKGVSLTGEHSKLDSILESVVNNMQFTTPKGTAVDASTNASTSITEKAAYRGATKGLAAAAVFVIFMIISWIRRKIKEKGNNADTDVMADSKATNNIPINDKQKTDIQMLAQNPGRTAENAAVTTDMARTNELNPQSQLNIENLRELKKLLDDGIITQEDFDAAKKKILG